MKRQTLWVSIQVLLVIGQLGLLLYMIHTKNERAEKVYVPTLYEKIEDYEFTEDGFGKVYEIRKPSSTPIDSIPINQFYISKDSNSVWCNTQYKDGLIMRYKVFISNEPITDSLLFEIGPVLIKAIKKAEKEMLENFKTSNDKKTEYDRIKENFIKSGHNQRL